MAGSIVDYASLQTAVANWMARAGNADLVANIPDFIGLAEGVINFGYDDPQMSIPALRVAQMEVPSTTVTILASSNTITLPPDFLQLRRIYAAGNPQQKLTYVTPNQMDSTINNGANVPPKFFTLMGGMAVTASPVDTTNTIVFGYYQKLPALSTSNTTNWLLSLHPSLYLHGALFEASLFIGGDDNETLKWGRLFAGDLRAFRKQDLNARYGGDALQMKTDVGNP